MELEYTQSAEKCKVGTAAPGLLLLDCGEVIMKTEYRNAEGRCECYIVSGGEFYCGEGDEAMCVPFVQVSTVSEIRCASE